jgi:oligoribonuclease
VNKADEFFAFVDTETTGIDIDQGHVPLEVGIAIVDRDFEIVDDFSVVIEWTLDEIMRKAKKADDEGRWVLATHAGNGLIEACTNKAIAMSPEQSDAELTEFMRMWFGGGVSERPPMCGSTIDFDRAYVRKWFSKTDQCFHYRSINISSVKELCRRLNPDLYVKLVEAGKEKHQEKHRVIPDLQDSVTEAKFYADNFLFQHWS